MNNESPDIGKGKMVTFLDCVSRREGFLFRHSGHKWSDTVGWQFLRLHCMSRYLSSIEFSSP